MFEFISGKMSLIWLYFVLVSDEWVVLSRLLLFEMSRTLLSHLRRIWKWKIIHRKDHLDLLRNVSREKVFLTMRRSRDLFYINLVNFAGSCLDLDRLRLDLMFPEELFGWVIILHRWSLVLPTIVTLVGVIINGKSFPLFFSRFWFVFRFFIARFAGLIDFHKENVIIFYRPLSHLLLISL